MALRFKILTFLFLLAGSFSYAQKSFNYHKDFKKIQERTKDTSDVLNYEKQLIRFRANDTTLTDFEVLALLIGFTTKPDFRPYSDLRIEREIFRLNGDGEYQRALDSANLFLEKHPLSQMALIEKAYSFYKLGNSDSSEYYRYQFKRIMEAMDFSGDGLKVPMFALGPVDGQNFIKKYLGATIGSMGSGTDKNDYFLDLLEVKYKNGSSETLRFIIQHATDKMFSKE